MYFSFNNVIKHFRCGDAR